ncbi:LegC family aminotransferase [Pedobacter hartonius]|uniref:GDP-perosamine synthase n=1 Tax=Pedobacter hartonius TaxID=425514 RepID=A0A1H4FRR4_9SPHI|nr:LegC family aminotransferase [Pedobacter hartonius]SEA99984.1 aminotransferase, LLPSF_NHT_00031 family [Pedobacter hartonius]
MGVDDKFQEFVAFVKLQYPNKDFIGLHEPVFIGNERKYVMDAIDSTFVSSVGAYVNRFEEMMAQITGAKYAIAIVNGTNALHMALLLNHVTIGDEVLSQALTFIATANAISYIGARPVFIDVDKDTLGMSPISLKDFLTEYGERRDNGFTYNKLTGKKIAACVPMHTFGLPCRIDEIALICEEWGIPLIEDAAESLGSYYKDKHTGVFGKVGVFSFNGNKTVTCGGGGALITDDETIAKRAKHLTTQAKVPHKWEFVHDEIGYNYRMPNLNAALACAQLEQLGLFVKNKRVLAGKYNELSGKLGISFSKETLYSKSNYWLNSLILDNFDERNYFLEFTNSRGVMTRPVWELMNRLPMFGTCQTDNLENSIWLADRVVNVPSGFRT